MTMKTEVPAKADFSAEMAEWIEAFDDVVAQEWENAAELLKALRQRGREAGGGGVQPLLSREVPCGRWERAAGGLDLPPGACVAGRVCAELPAGAIEWRP